MVSLYKPGLQQASFMPDVSLLREHQRTEANNLRTSRRAVSKYVIRINCVSPEQCLVAISLKSVISLEVLKEDTRGSVECFLVVQLDLSHFCETSFYSNEGSCCPGVAVDCQVFE